MIVIAIIGILVVVAIPVCRDCANRARVAEGISLSLGARLVMRRICRSTGRYLVADYRRHDLRVAGSITVKHAARGPVKRTCRITGSYLRTIVSVPASR